MYTEQYKMYDTMLFRDGYMAVIRNFLKELKTTGIIGSYSLEKVRRKTVADPLFQTYHRVTFKDVKPGYEQFIAHEFTAASTDESADAALFTLTSKTAGRVSIRENTGYFLNRVKHLDAEMMDAVITAIRDSKTSKALIDEYAERIKSFTTALNNTLVESDTMAVYKFILRTKGTK